MEISNTTLALPRIALITDVPVERTNGGSLLLHRLFSGYPPERLLVIHSSIYRSAGNDRRLPNVEYRSVDYVIPRYAQSRINPFGPWQQIRRMRQITPAVTEAIGRFCPEGIITVAHDYLWVSATVEARNRGIPFHFIIHDDWRSMAKGRRRGITARIANLLADQAFRPTYRSATQRFCIGPGMEETYRARYGPAGEILYPNRGGDSPHPFVRVGRRDPGGPPVGAFAGAVHTEGVLDLLIRLANVLRGLKGHLDIYTNSDAAALERRGLRAPFVQFQGFLDPTDLAERIADSADFLFLPASFKADERDLVSTLFPSKLADYTAIGIPIVIWGPEYSSAARWGLDNPDAAVIETASDGPHLREIAANLALDHDEGARIAECGINCGSRDFSLDAAQTRLFAALANCPVPGRIEQ